MRLLLDTHALLWWLGRDSTLSAQATDAIADASSTIYVSAASAWEIAIKSASGKLRAPSDLVKQIENHSFIALPVRIDHALLAGSLPRHHGDAFDRMLIAQAQLEGLTVVTRDVTIAKYGTPVLLA